jgi:GT2 family glycosyltransferase
MPAVSVIICTYNREESLCDVLSDVIAQRFRDFETIVVDQTPVHTPTTIDFLARHRTHFRHLEIEEPNLPGARNLGVAAATGDIVVFMDDDIRVSPGFLGEVLDVFADGAVSAMAPRVVPEPYEPGWEPPMPRLRRRSRAAPRPLRQCIGACFAVRRRVLVSLGGSDPVLGRLNANGAVGEDDDLTRRITAAGHRLWYDPRITVRHANGVAGGCENRTGPKAFDLRRHARANAYIILKEERAFDRLTGRALLRFVRLTSFRRDVILAGPRAFVRGLNQIRPLVAEVRAFVREDGGSARDALLESIHNSSPL